MGCTSSISRSISRSFSTYTFYPTNPVFGVPLINVVCSDKSPYVAKVVVECAEFLERDENITKNIYCSLRKLSDQKSIDKLKQKIHVDGKYDAIKCEDAHVVADVLLQFFKELRPSIIHTKNFQATFDKQTDFHSEESQRDLIRYLRRMDAESYDTLKYLIQHLYTVSKYGANDASEMADLWAPYIFSPECGLFRLNYSSVVQILINRYREIFAD